MAHEFQPAMNARLKQTFVEWGFVAFLLVLCGILTVLQYRWTGEVARAESARLRGNLVTQAQALAREFDAELSATCDQLTPDRSNFAIQSQEAAHLARIFHTLSSRDAARARLARRPKRFRTGLYEYILSGSEREANAAGQARSKS